MNITHSDDVEDLPPSAKFVAWVLEDQGELTRDELAEETNLPSKTVDYALDRLQDVDAVESRPHAGDARRRFYKLKTY